MYIKDFDYEQIAFTIVKKFIDTAKQFIEVGKIPAKFNMDYAINQYLPEKYLDDNTTAINYWTKHNEKKLRKYIQTEITKRKAICILNINYIKEINTKKGIDTCIKILT